MTNPKLPNKDVRDAARKASEATALVERIMLLPTEIGAKVRWTNDLVWERVGEDGWWPDSIDRTDARWPNYPWPSSHIASSLGWTVVA